MQNPVKAKREYIGLTQEELASRAGVTRQVITLSEQGLYNTLSNKITDVLTTDGLSRAVLIANYHTWVIQKRAENQHLFMKVDLRLARPKHEWSCLKTQVAGKSQQAFCRALVYQPSLVREYEKFGRGSAGIFEALRQCGLEQHDIEKLAASSPR